NNVVNATVMQKNTSGERHSRSGATHMPAAASTAADNQMHSASHFRPVWPPAAKTGMSLRGKVVMDGSKKRREIAKSTVPSRESSTRKTPVAASKKRFAAANRASSRSVTEVGIARKFYRRLPAA